MTLRDFYLARGVTTVYDMSSPVTGHKIYRELASKGQLPVRLRINYIVGANDLNGAKNDVLGGTPPGSGATGVR